ncbi:MAG: AlpA family transcriptional regulator, partial [Salinicola sp.]|nr:AlpA family transcriptional regulator [Salinicola sp.]
MANVSTTTAFQKVERIELGNRLLRRRDVELKTGKSRSAIYAGVRNGTFPAPVPIGDKSVAWLEEEVDSWIAA